MDERWEQDHAPLCCPTCGRPIRTVTSDEGTSHYEPVTDTIRVAHVKELEAERDGLRGNWLTSDRAARDAEQALSSLRSRVEQAVSKLREDPRNQEPREVAAMLEAAILDETGGTA